MFNRKDYRVFKKIYSTSVLVKKKNNLNYYNLFQKSRRLPCYKLLLMYTNTKVIFPGVKNVCSVTGNYRAVFNSMKISRHVYRDFGGTSALSNFSKVSW